MKRILFGFIISMCFLVKLNAECNYSDIVELNTLASHISYTYEYNETNQNFDVTLYNTVNKLKLEYLKEIIESNNNKIVISNVIEGTKLYIRILSSQNTECENKLLRTINIYLPYKNEYYNSSYCEHYIELPICSTRFLDYDISYDIFKNILDKQRNQTEKEEKPEEKENEIITESIINLILNFFKNHWIEIAVVIGSGLITFIVGNIIYKKIKYKF